MSETKLKPFNYYGTLTVLEGEDGESFALELGNFDCPRQWPISPELAAMLIKELGVPEPQAEPVTRWRGSEPAPTPEPKRKPGTVTRVNKRGEP